MVAAKFGSILPSWEQSIAKDNGERAMENQAGEAIHLDDRHDE